MPRVSGTKRSILDAALELASLNGITGTTMEDVAVRAGVAKGSVYYNFSSKDKLFEQLLLDGIGALAETLREAREGRSGGEALGSMITAMLEAISGNQPLAKLIAAEIFRTDRSWQTPSAAGAAGSAGGVRGGHPGNPSGAHGRRADGRHHFRGGPGGRHRVAGLLPRTLRWTKSPSRCSSPSQAGSPPRTSYRYHITTAPDP